MPTQNGILGYSAYGTGTAAAAGTKPSNLAEAVQSFITDGGYRDQVIRDPNGAAKAAGVDVGRARIEIKYQEIKGQAGKNAGASQLLIVVNGAGVNWTGDATIVLYK